ncbi:protein translocase subunit SecF [Methylophaga sp. OBS1]|jgi:preprotein translocase subunit SecF|uniref:protein translocase subunit SecF n=1 Tax=Methylophaga sp. OBS1 TaxID=2991933 RepID=UPI0022534D85|nr:protein translocase subunit SecF [Methylophaga sp. OBS1]MCX4193883.1 protein translocase subunit SecF [Methylophaga sp. OBS1]
MQFLSNETHINFMSKRLLAAVFSIILVILSVGSLVTQGLNFGIDFTGGTMIELGYKEQVDLNQLRQDLSEGGYPEATVQNFGSIHDVLIRLPVIETQNMAELSNEVVAMLQSKNETEIDVRRVEFVGPQVGDELTEQGGLAMLYALIGILIYVSLRFEYRFAIGSVVALIHDVVITLGFFSLTRIEFDLTVLAAILAIIGYSLNDTIVVFDRIRETFLRMRKGTSVEIVNAALNDTLSRTLMTSLTTLLVVMALFIFGGEVIHAFSIALLFGIVIGTYSSIYIASNTILVMGVSKEDLLPPVKEDDENVNPDGSQV